MTVETKYEPGTEIFLIIGSDEKARMIKGEISNINIDVTKTRVTFIYGCYVSREDLGLKVEGSPKMTTISRKEGSFFTSEEECLKSIDLSRNKK